MVIGGVPSDIASGSSSGSPSVGEAVERPDKAAHTSFADATVDKSRGPLLGSPNRLRLAVFSFNMVGGTTLTHADGPPAVTWPESVAIAQAADNAGIEAVIPVARWRGPSTDPGGARHRSFEPFAWAAGIAAVTTRTQVFATVHLPTMHPLRAAKEVATVDHISGGRFGLNVVAGWNADEFRMFDLALAEHDDRYEVAGEWMDFLGRASAPEQPFDFHGRHFRGSGVISEPRPVQRPGPVIMSAGFSPAGRAFAARHADINFAIVPPDEQGRRAIREIKQTARERWDRDVLVFGAAHILCRDTEGDARREYARVVQEMGDRPAAANAIRLLMPSSQSAEFAPEMTESAIFGFFATPMVGTASQVCEMMAEMSAAGMDGLAVSWVDYRTGIDQYVDELCPLLVREGLRSA